MSGWNSKAWRTWQGKETPEPTDEECVQSCVDNAEEAARREAMLRDRLERMAPGDPRINGSGNEVGIRQQIAAAVSDQAHWREYARWYREQLKNKAPHWSEREPGSDDEYPF